MNPKLMSIQGYKVKLERNEVKMRLASHVKSGIKYRKISDLEMKNVNMVVIDKEGKKHKRIINIKRSFTNNILTEREFFDVQLETIETILTDQTIILDLNKEINETYYLKQYQNNLMDFKT
jgi:hypothetical protein